MPKIKVSIVDDEELFSEGLAMLLKQYEHLDIISTAKNGSEFLRQLKTKSLNPNVVLLDLQMSETDGIETSKILTKEFPEIKIIIVSSHFNKGLVYNMLKNGAVSYLKKTSELSTVYKTIMEVHRNGFYYTSELQGIISEYLGNNKKSSTSSFKITLTKREKEILYLICTQYTNAEIASKLHISARTVDGHRQNLLRKLQCKNTAGLVAIAIKNQLVDFGKY